MPLGTFVSGGASQIKIGTADPPTILIGGVKSATYSGQRPTNTDDFYNQQASDTSVGKATRRWTVQGSASSADSGLALARDSFNDDTGPIIYISGSLEGTNGEVLPVRVANFEVGFPNPNQKSTYSITFEQAGNPTTIGAGILG